MNLVFSLLAVLLLALCALADTDYYQLLGVARNANDQQLKKAFKKLSLKYHPDKNKGNEEVAKKKFAEIVNAYEVLKDPDQRRVYD
jgi:DnaJ family protein C protein 16